MSAGDQREVLEALADGTVRFVFLAPEQLAKPEVVDAVRDARPALFVVDEAHCVSAWGHDFRPDYLRLGGVIEQLGHPTVLALTATAAPPVRAEIVERLEMRDAADRRRRLRPAGDPPRGRPVRRRLRQGAGRPGPGARRDRRGPRPGHRLQRHPPGHRGGRRRSWPTAGCASGRTTPG